jgi:hypothetical protein
MAPPLRASGCRDDLRSLRRTDALETGSHTRHVPLERARKRLVEVIQAEQRCRSGLARGRVRQISAAAELYRWSCVGLIGSSLRRIGRNFPVGAGAGWQPARRPGWRASSGSSPSRSTQLETRRTVTGRIPVDLVRHRE